MPKLSEFVPGICCAHDWLARPQNEVCTICRATCHRGKDGKIEMYSAAVKAPEVRQ